MSKAILRKTIVISAISLTGMLLLPLAAVKARTSPQNPPVSTVSVTERADTAGSNNAHPSPIKAKLEQRGSTIVWTTTFNGTPKLSVLARPPHNLSCLHLNSAKKRGENIRLCLRRDQKQQLYLAEERVNKKGRPTFRRRSASKIRATQRALSVTIDTENSGIRSGSYRWYVSNHVARQAHRLPLAGQAQMRVYRRVAQGCSAASGRQMRRAAATKRKLIALTYDDGPGALTPQFLRVLKKENARATFFVLGVEAQARPRVIKQIHSDGHAIGNHSYAHTILRSGNSSAVDSLKRTNDIVRRITGYTPCVMRPPYGETSGALLNALRPQKMASVLWSTDTNDWQNRSAHAIAEQIIREAHPGAIVLMHDGGARYNTLAATRIVIPRLKSLGYELVTVPELLRYETTWAYKP